MLLSQWWELEETAIRCKLGMWGKKWQAKKRQKKALPTCLPFFCPCIQSYSLTCCASFHQPAMEKGTLHSYTPVRSQPRHTSVSPRAFPDQHMPWEDRGQPARSRGPGRLSGVGKEAERPRRGCALWKPSHISALRRATGRLQLSFQGLHEVVTLISPFFWWFIFLGARRLCTVLHLLHAKHPFIPHNRFLQLS